MLELRVGPRREGGTLTTGTITEPVPPVPLAPERTPFDVIIERFDAIDKRLDQQGTAIVKLAEMQTMPAVPGQVPAVANVMMNNIGSIIDIVKQALGGSGAPGNDLMLDLYKQAHANFDQKVLMPTFTNLAKGEIRHVTTGSV